MSCKIETVESKIACLTNDIEIDTVSTDIDNQGHEEVFHEEDAHDDRERIVFTEKWEVLFGEKDI